MSERERLIRRLRNYRPALKECEKGCPCVYCDADRAAALLREQGREPDGEIHQLTFKAVVQFYRGFEERLTDLAEAVWRATAEPKCGRCGHPQGWHRHDDTTESDAFRCIGYDCWAPGRPKEPCGCPDYVEPRASATTSEPAAAPYCPHCGNGVLQEHVPGCPAASAVTP